ncbi:hypothetical protein DL768_007346 [Monosporascus sp. mg162]|nr:hypothetical protein DL768_007346 [Monosporascus sp. mg162]
MAEAASPNWGRLDTIDIWSSVAVGAVGVTVFLGTWLCQRRRRRPAADEEAVAAIPLVKIGGPSSGQSWDGTHVAAVIAVTQAMTRRAGGPVSALVADVFESFGKVVDGP